MVKLGVNIGVGGGWIPPKPLFLPPNRIYLRVAQFILGYTLILRKISPDINEILLIIIVYSKF